VLSICDRAAELLEREGAFDRAFELHMRVDDARRAGLLPPHAAPAKLHVARIARSAGRSDVARQLCEEVAVAARASADAELLARAALLHGADLRPGVVDRSLVTLLEEARDALGESAPALGCKVLARLAAALQPATDPTVPMDMARDAIRGAKATGDDGLVLEVLELAGSALVDYAPLEERIATSDELLARAVRAGDRPKALRAHARLAFEHLEAGDFEAFDRDTTSLLALSDELGHPRYRWRALLIASARAVTLGNFAESDRYVVEVAQLAPLTDDPAIALSLAAHAMMRARIQRRDDEMPAMIAAMESVMHGVAHAAVISAATRATVYARMEDADGTRRQLAIVGASGAALEVDVSFLAWMAESYAVAGSDEQRRRTRDRLAASRLTEVVSGHIPYTYEGTYARLVGLLDAALGDLASAEQHLRDAYAKAGLRGHATWVAQTAYELARVIRRAGRDGEARALLEESERIARQLGMTGLVAAATRARATDVVGQDEAQPSRMTPAAVTLANDGDGWRIARGDRVARVRDTRGMKLLARLVERPDEEIHVLALASDDGASVAESSAGEVLDERARRAYRERVAALDEDIAEAERHADAGRLDKLRHEREALVAELSRSVGLGGRARQTGSATERARVNVQRRLKDAIGRIREADEVLGRFFERAVRTGTFCCFRP
jgi:hypothetical protein